MSLYSNHSGPANATLNEIPANTRRVPLIVVCTIFPILGTLTVFLRFWVRTFLNHARGRDDYIMYAAWMVSIGFVLCTGVELGYGLGKFSREVSLEHIERITQVTFFSEQCYYTTMYLIRMSILLFYIRLAANLQSPLRFRTILLMLLMTANYITTTVVTFFICRPFFYWHTPIAGYCIDELAFIYETSIFTIVTDVVIMLLPIPIIYKAKLYGRTRWAAMAVFLIGIFSTISSCIRLYAVEKLNSGKDQLYVSATIITWSLIEMNMGMICASGPSLHQFFLRATTRSHVKHSSGGNSSSGVVTIGGSGGEQRVINKAEETMPMKDENGSLKLDPREERVETCCARKSSIGMVDINGINMDRNRIAIMTYTSR